MSNGVINVLFSTMKGSKHTAQLKNGYTVDDIRKSVQEKFGSGNFRLIVNGKEIRDDAPAEFEALKKEIKNNTIIYVCQRLDGGSNMVDVDTHRATILTDLENELLLMPVQNTASECLICNEEKRCIKYCCSTVICKECFATNFIHAGYKVRCLTCNKVLPPREIFVSQQLILSLSQLDETMKMAQNIDFQICTCGAFSINETMYAKQKCNHCNRWFCFFCNADWDEQTKKMRNEQYTCRVNCYWETKITYQTVPLEFNKNMQVPNRRCCPKCFECGSYDQKCKYHRCPCGHQFCFICLETEPECKRKYNSQYNRPCNSKIVQQSFAMFPRLCRP